MTYRFCKILALLCITGFLCFSLIAGGCGGGSGSSQGKGQGFYSNGTGGYVKGVVMAQDPRLE